MTTQESLPLTVRKEIDTWITKFPPEQRQAAVIPALRIVQAHNGGWLTDILIEQVAEFLHMPKIAVYEVATFYTMFELKPVGRHLISLCTNVSCMLCGCDKIAAYLKDKLNVDFGETTQDGKFTLKEVECLAACGGAPAMQVGTEYFENLTPTDVDKILSTLD